jgi:integrase
MKLIEVVSLYVSHKRALGYRYRSEEAILRSFCKQIGNESIATIEPKAVMTFINGNGPVTEYCVKKYRTLSGLYRYAMVRGLAKGSPLPINIPKPTVPEFVPYIYTHEELKRLIDTVPAACEGRAPIQEEVLRLLILLLYGAGLRLGEALALTIGDVDLQQKCLRVRDTKFFKSRLVPLGKDLAKILTEYVVRHLGPHTAPSQVPLFYFIDGSPLSQSAARNAFRRLRSHAGIMRDGGSRRQPRFHDLRHTAAVHRIITWYRSGKDVQKLLPKLATYLGHSDLSSTQRYLTMTPELLKQANLRFEHYAIGGKS